MVTVITRDGQKIHYPDADGFRAEHPIYGIMGGNQAPPPMLLLITKDEPRVNQPAPNFPGGYTVDHVTVGQQNWDDVLAVAVGDIHRG